MDLFHLNSWALAFVLVVIVFGTTVAGVLVGRRLRHRRDEVREPIGAMQTAILGFVGLLLAFGLTMAVGRFEVRRSAVVTEANAIGTTFLRAQTISEPQRSQSIDLLREYVKDRQALSHRVPDSRAYRQSVADAESIQRKLWSLAGAALVAAPDANSTRLYVDSLNVMIDAAGSREAAIADRIPTSVSILQIGGAALALGILGLYLSALGSRVVTALLAAGLVWLILLVALDLDRPQRGFITVPSRALDSLVISMSLDPAAAAPPPTG